MSVCDFNVNAFREKQMFYHPLFYKFVVFIGSHKPLWYLVTLNLDKPAISLRGAINQRRLILYFLVNRMHDTGDRTVNIACSLHTLHLSQHISLCYLITNIWQCDVNNVTKVLLRMRRYTNGRNAVAMLYPFVAIREEAKWSKPSVYAV